MSINHMEFCDRYKGRVNATKILPHFKDEAFFQIH